MPEQSRTIYRSLVALALFAAALSPCGGEAKPVAALPYCPVKVLANGTKWKWNAETKEWEPPNADYWVGVPEINPPPHELPPFLDPAYGIKRHSLYLLGPKGSDKAVFPTEFDAAFNPTSWVEYENGEPVIYLVPRLEKNKDDDPNHKRESRPGLVRFRPHAPEGKTIEMVMPEIVPGLDEFEHGGGKEDFRFADLHLKPAVLDGKSYTKMLTYVAYDGKVPRIRGVLFNKAEDFKTGNFVKLPPFFKDEDVAKNPSVPDLNPAWNKSASVVQYKDQAGKVHTVVYFNEGSATQGGVWAIDTEDPIRWKYPTDRAIRPPIQTREGKWDHGLVEAAFQPQLIHLPPEYVKKTGGLQQALFVPVHGAARGYGYMLGFELMDPEHPTDMPRYRSEGIFFKPETPQETRDAQVRNVVFMPGMVIVGEDVYFFYGAGDRYVGVAQGKLRAGALVSPPGPR